jgi:tetratricopeptide (TPR) repeat protein
MADASGCSPEPLPLSQLDDTIWRLQLEPHERARLWIIEDGSDVEIETAHGTIDSAPQQQALEPVTVVSDASGHAQLDLRLRSGAEPLQITARRRCSSSPWLDALIDRVAITRPVGFTEGGASAALQTTILAAAGLAISPARSEAHVWLLTQSASLARSGGFLAEAAGLYRLAAEAAVDDPVRRAWASVREAQALLSLGSPAAGEALARAAETAAAVGAPLAAAIAAHDQCVWRRIRGDIEGAVVCFGRAADKYARIGELAEQGNAYFNRANAQQMLGQYADARASLELAEKSGLGADPRQSMVVSWFGAQLARWQGDFERTLSLLRSALSTAQEGGYTLDEAHAIRLLGLTYAVIGEPVRALDYYGWALSIYQGRGVAARAAAVEATMARVLESERRYPEALALLASAKEVLLRSGTSNEAGSVRIDIARVQAASGLHAEALATLSEAQHEEGALSWRLQAEARALQLAIDPPDDAATLDAELLPLLGAAQEAGHMLLYLEIAAVLVEQRLRLGATDDALELASTGSRMAEQLASSLRSPGLRHAVLRRARSLALVGFASLDGGTVSDSEATSAMAAVERLRHVERTPLPAASTTQTAPVGSDTFDELERWLTAEALHSSEPIPAARRHAAMLAVEAAGPATSDHPRDKLETSAFSLPELGRGEVLLYPALGERTGGLLVGSETGWRWHDGIDVRELRDTVRLLRDRLASGHVELTLIDEGTVRLSALMKWQGLFAGTPKRLYIVADADLVGLPWDLLPVPESTGQPLGAVTEIVLLQTLRPQQARRPSAVLAMSASPAEGSRLASLEDAEREVGIVTGHWRQRLASRRVDANLEALGAALATIGAIVHVAAHGRADKGFAEESGLWLFEPGQDQPRFISALRLRHLPQRSSLVVLSACEGAHAVASRSIGMSGVAGSIIDAGGQAVVSALWPVSDRAAMTFASAFHAHLSRDPTAVAAALLQAKSELRASPAYRHPTHWAGWVLLQSGPLSAPQR